MLERSISGLLKKRNLGWNLNSEGLGLEFVDSDCQIKRRTLLLVRINCLNVCTAVASAVEWGRHIAVAKGCRTNLHF
jgi:hypothetical protein